MTVHNYKSRQVHKTLNGLNPSSSFRDMRSAKSGPNLWQIWQVFGSWTSPYGANGQMAMTVHNNRPRQFHRTSNGENPSSGYRDMGSASPLRDLMLKPAGHWMDPYFHLLIHYILLWGRGEWTAAQHSNRGRVLQAISSIMLAATRPPVCPDHDNTPPAQRAEG